MMNTRESAQWFRAERGIYCVPAPPMEKGPRLKDWNLLRISEPEEFARYFNGERQNLCVLTGIDNLTDVDLDSMEAVWAWSEYALPTGMKWGHGDVTPTHFLYYADEPPTSIKYLDPAMDDPKKACMIELRCWDKGGKCLNTMAPPSIHPDNEDVEFAPGGAGFPAKAGRHDLERRVRLTFTASMLGRHARKGVCHDIFLALSGALRRAEWPLEDAQRLVRAIFRAKWQEDADLGAANTEVSSTYKHFDGGGETTGLLKLSTLIDERVFKRAKHLLGLDHQEDWMHAQEAPKRAPRVLPESEPIENLRHRKITKPEALIEGFILRPSVTLLVAPGKVGKTVLGVAMVMSVANGIDLFDMYTTSRDKVPGLIVEWDDQQGESSLQDFLLKCRASRPDQLLDIVLKPKEPFTISDPEFRPWLTAQILKRPAKFCLLDSLTALRGFGSDDKTRNVVKLEASEILMLGEIAIETNCAIILIHHDSKTAAGLDLFSRAAGTFALQACSETQITLGRFPELGVDDPARVVSVRGRHLRGLQAVLKFREETLDYDFILEGALVSLYPKLVKLLRTFRGKEFDAKQAKEPLGCSLSKTYEVLSELVYGGILNKQSGTWKWNPNWTQTLEKI